MSNKYNQFYLLKNFMKKIFFILLLFSILFSSTFAENNYETDYTLIDCINWDNTTGVAFDNSKPYATLKAWIENTIKYINNNINKIWNEETASWKVFSIKVECSFDDVLNPSINLNYNWEAFNNELIIEWIWDNSLIFKEVDFKLSHEAWNITFKNAIFNNENKPYFYDYVFPPATRYWTRMYPFSNWIKIINSYINLNNNKNIWNIIWYRSYFYKWYNRNYFDSLTSYSNYQIIENSIINIEIDSDFVFILPTSIKNTKISFKNKVLSGSLTWNEIYNITFSNGLKYNDLNFSVLTSNEINLWWNNFISENTQNISYLNNNFINFSDFNFWGNSIFINNFIDNNLSIDISSFHDLYNNIFKSGYTSSYDIMNNRRNFSENNISWGLWWIYKRIRTNKYFNIDINSASLYKEITGKELPNGLGDIYVIFNY